MRAGGQVLRRSGDFRQNSRLQLSSLALAKGIRPTTDSAIGRIPLSRTTTKGGRLIAAGAILAVGGNQNRFSLYPLAASFSSRSRPCFALPLDSLLFC
jgi:hypothetical protein